MLIKFTVFWKVSPCSLVDSYHCFVRSCSVEVTLSLEVIGFQNGDIHILNFTTSPPNIPKIFLAIFVVCNVVSVNT